MAFQRRTWRLERIGWAVLAGLVGAGLLGVFGGGWLGTARAVTADGSFALEYDRFWRLQAPTRLRLSLLQPTAVEQLRVWIGREYLEAMSIDRIVPEPERVEAAADRVVFVFTLADAAEPAEVQLRIEPERAWRVRGRVGIEGGQTLEFGQFIYP